MRVLRVHQLCEQVAAIEGRGGAKPAEHSPVDLGWVRLPRGRLHEWLSEGPPPLCLLTGIVHRGLNQPEPPEVPGRKLPGAGVVCWVGRSCWPYPRQLGPRLDRHLLVDPLPRDRLWTLDLLLRHEAVGAVIAEGRGLDLTATRRLQLAAEAGGALALIARPSGELRHPSAAATRWLVQPQPNPGRHDQLLPRWRVQLVRNKDATLNGFDQQSWTIEWQQDAMLMCVAEELADRSAPAARAG